VYTQDICYDKLTGEPAVNSNACDPYLDKAKNELEYSDKIIYGDLLRFYRNN
jgi:phosphoglycerol transferase MdoB-like AlkP superfamily enzyme